ncbi:unnamed protein product [Adineta ricciae]|uniref:F-box domain-containing protein n=1 Tax=Adineta ricciae TaxID=249248 RepID=A0A815R3L8_ADIRI|nr:unnamed protein product [Adineta ricciae]CAF1471171.1 unnamed protein product [Adineta ricciae]
MDNIFPDEIFLRIFRYLPRVDLFRGFYNLNFRLNRIISEARVHFGDVDLSEDEQKYILPYVQPKQIRSFPVYEEKYKYLRLNECVNIGRLIFRNSSPYNVYTYQHPDLIHVKPSIFPHLKHLTIYVQSWSNVYINLCKMIFGNEFLTLESVELPYGNGTGWTSQIKTWSINLKNVKIQCCNMSMYYPLLNNLPNILRFHCGFGATYRASLTKECLPLTHLTLETYDIWSTSSEGCPTAFHLSDMMDLFKRSPNLEDTTLYIRGFYELEDVFDQLHRVLSNCPKLTSYYCDLLFHKKSSVSINEIKKRYRLFEDCTAYISEGSKQHRCYLRKYR